jgi:hypothetical protein
MRNPLAIRLIIQIFIIFSSITLGTANYVISKKPTFFTDGYIYKIDTPNYGNDVTIEFLREFNNMSATGRAVSFRPTSTHSIVLPQKAITIKEVSKIVGQDNVAGLALSLWNTCDISIRSGEDYETYRQILIHEYLHCLGFNHVNNVRDVMNPEVGFPTEESFQAYAKEIEDRRNGRF